MAFVSGNNWQWGAHRLFQWRTEWSTSTLPCNRNYLPGLRLNQEAYHDLDFVSLQFGKKLRIHTEPEGRKTHVGNNDDEGIKSLLGRWRFE